jgi:hypothetical protein
MPEIEKHEVAAREHLTPIEMRALLLCLGSLAIPIGESDHTARDPDSRDMGIQTPDPWRR